MFVAMAVFQFPSNGKVDPNNVEKAVSGATLYKFQFPSNGKVDPNLPNQVIIQFNFKFQFPSNGKVDPNPYPLRSSDTKAPKRQNQTRIARRFFLVKKGHQNATNPRQH